MSTLDTQYQRYLSENPDSNFTFEEWKKEVLEPNATKLIEHTEALIELQKMTQKLIDKENSEKNK